jgi:hypothetical protein
MGRGRAKAKQTKVARELKYRNYNTDFSELQRELHGDTEQRELPGDTEQRELPGDMELPEPEDSAADEGDEFEDPYADLYDDESESAPQR